MYLFKRLFPAILIGSLVTAGAATAQTISIVSGDGAIVTQNNVTLNNLEVVVRSVQGQPLSGATVTWTVNGQGSVTGGATTTTAADGTSSNSFLGPTLFNLSYAQAVVNASAFGSSVNFTMTTSGLDLTASQAAVVRLFVPPCRQIRKGMLTGRPQRRRRVMQPVRQTAPAPISARRTTTQRSIMIFE